MSVLESEHDKKYKMMDIIAKIKSSENINKWRVLDTSMLVSWVVGTTTFKVLS